MPGFDSGTVVDPLDWDFTAHGAGKGTVPEPSEKRLNKFLTDLTVAQQGAQEALAGVTAAGNDPEKMLAAIAELPDGALPSVTSVLTKPYAELCGGSPTLAQLNKLPPRVRLAFFAWLGGELNPEAGSAASPPALRSVS
jgi:hypothetical protein